MVSGLGYEHLIGLGLFLKWFCDCLCRVLGFISSNLVYTGLRIFLPGKDSTSRPEESQDEDGLKPPDPTIDARRGQRPETERRNPLSLLYTPNLVTKMLGNPKP